MPERHYILVVDDEPELRAIIKESLEATHTTVVLLADDGDDARALLQACVFDLIIADINMPNFDGIELYQWIQEKQPGLHGGFIFLSAAGRDPSTLDRLAELPDVTLIHKPFSVSKLEDHVRGLLPRKQQPAGTRGPNVR